LIPAESRIGTVLGVVMVLIIYMGFTVHFWGSVWILVGLLTGLRASLGELGWLNRRDLVGSGSPG
jgi:Mg/Co/Ni transporter MgtE